ncbi:response regulator [Sulfurimonas aquatica]|uniref:histidine kinase n=1 Tax=Sulfurimonas aquatica TaxID=2672570 RepID=A0A975GDP7_9BACT|nr:response regulator [Sulfurimonas aquatica]QSZ42905.1 response regulator [Sulfurimonas aquatica]
MNAKELELKINKLDYLYSSLLNSMVGAMGIAVLLYFSISGHVDPVLLNIWLFLTFLLSFIRIIFYMMYKKCSPAECNLNFYYNVFAITVLTSSVLWGITGVILLPQELELQVLLLMMVGGLSTGAALSLASNVKLFYIFIIFSMGPFVYVFMMNESQLANSLLTTSIFYMLFLTVISKKMSNRIIASMTLEYENKNLINNLELKVKEANSDNNAKSKFLSVMSHEIRTPLNAIIGFVQILEKSEKDPQKKSYLEIVDKSSEMLMNVINDILDLTKIESGKVVIESVEYEPTKELESVFNLYKVACSQKKIKIINSISPDLPQYIIGDSLRLKQIVSNLLSNALKFTKEGKDIELISSFNKEKAMLYVEVRDEGIGIDSENMKKITGEFTQADDSVARKYGGTGLGLSIVSKFLTLQKSELQIRSEFGVGSSFYFELPVELVEHEQEEEEQERELLFSTKHILVAEDNKTNQMLIEILLEDYEIDVTIANDGVEAVELSKAQEFDLILMDINMPNKNGSEAMKDIKQRGDKTPIVALTANAVAGDKQKYLEEGFDDYLAKPIDNAEFQKVLIKYL